MALDFPSSPVDGQVYGNYFYSTTKGAWRSATQYNTPSVLRNINATTASASLVPLTVTGYASQSANLQEWKNSSGTTLANIDSNGMLNATSGANFTLGPGALNLKAAQNDHTYMQFFARTASQSTRSGYFGYSTTGSNDITLGNEISGGNITFIPGSSGQVNLPTKTYMPGAVVQVAEVRAAAGDKSASTSAVDIISTTFTTKLANSKLVLIWHSGQVLTSAAQVNMMIFFTIDGVDLPDFSTNHYFYGDFGGISRHVATIPVMTGALSLGSHTIKVRGQAYNGTATYDYQSSSSAERRSRLLIMEVAQ